jgi:ATP/maltotriose-dependent transcriptional regulator MalT
VVSHHHLFADVLRTHLADERPDDVQQLQQRASDWYEQNSQRPDAIHHAFAARDSSRAAELVELAWPTRRNRREENVLPSRATVSRAPTHSVMRWPTVTSKRSPRRDRGYR